MNGTTSTPSDFESRMRQRINVGYLILSGFSNCFTVMLRHRFGGQAFGLNAVASIVIMLLFMMSFPASIGLPNFFFVWWIAILCQRVGHFARRVRGIVLHSRYDGEPWIETFLPRLGTHVPRVLEIALCAWAASDLAATDPGFSRLCLSGAAALAAKWLIDGHVDHQRVQRMHDAEIEQRSLVDRWSRGGF